MKFRLLLILLWLSSVPFALDGAQKAGEETRPQTAGSGYCAASVQPMLGPLAGSMWNGWGSILTNTRFQPAASAGLAVDAVPKLKLKWAFGFPNANEASAQPVVVGGRVYVGSWGREVYSLDANTGCIYWSLATQAVVRAAFTLGSMDGGGVTAYFGDRAASVYAVNAATGTLLWKRKIDDHPRAQVTGSPVLHQGRLIVPVSSGEEGASANPTYECCTFRGSVVSLDATTGRQIWKTYTIPDAPRPTEKNPHGIQRWGPSGAPIWSAPTVDVKRNVIYVATGNSYSPPAAQASDAVVALNAESGKVLWTRQLQEGDTWNSSCQPRVPDHANCPDRDDPDFDFGASPILVELGDGRRMLVAGQKSGLVHALDPDRDGAVLWQQRVGRGGLRGGVMWGPAVDTDTAYVAVSDATVVGATTKFDPTVGGGLVALNLADGQKRWTAPAKPCRDLKISCTPAQAAAVTVIPGVVFSGSVDGHLRAYSTRDGSVVWDYDVVREFPTVNGVKARGGTINHGGVAVVDGMVFAHAGYAHGTAIYPGNVLLAFRAEE